MTLRAACGRARAPRAYAAGMLARGTSSGTAPRSAPAAAGDGASWPASRSSSPSAAPTAAQPVIASCPACGEGITSLMQITCSGCGEALRDAEFFGRPIRRKPERHACGDAACAGEAAMRSRRPARRAAVMRRRGRRRVRRRTSALRDAEEPDLGEVDRRSPCPRPRRRGCRAGPRKTTNSSSVRSSGLSCCSSRGETSPRRLTSTLSTTASKTCVRGPKRWPQSTFRQRPLRYLALLSPSRIVTVLRRLRSWSATRGL